MCFFGSTAYLSVTVCTVYNQAVELTEAACVHFTLCMLWMSRQLRQLKPPRHISAVHKQAIELECGFSAFTLAMKVIHRQCKLCTLPAPTKVIVLPLVLWHLFQEPEVELPNLPVWVVEEVGMVVDKR